MRDTDIQSLKRPRHKARYFQTKSNYGRQTYVKLTNQLKSKTKEAFHRKGPSSILLTKASKAINKLLNMQKKFPIN